MILSIPHSRLSMYKTLPYILRKSLEILLEVPSNDWYISLVSSLSSGRERKKEFRLLTVMRDLFIHPLCRNFLKGNYNAIFPIKFTFE